MTTTSECRSGKRTYANERNARLAARRTARRFGFARPYRCDWCRSWHVTSQRRLR